jgi:hypothetical protein
MSRWRARLAELQGETHCPPARVQIVQNVQNPAHAAPFEQIEQFEQHAKPTEPPAVAWTEALNERAAIIEYDGGAPRVWSEALARLDPANPPADVPPLRWFTFLDDCGLFVDRGWAARAAAFGWGPVDLFGCDRERPFARVDHLGLLWLLKGGTIIELHRDRAVIETPAGARQTYGRRPIDIGRVVLAWELGGEAK